MEDEIRQELVDIKDMLTDIIPKIEENNILDNEGLNELKETRIVIWSKIQEIDLNSNSECT